MKKLPKELSDKIKEIRNLKLNQQYEIVLNEVSKWKELHPKEYYEVD